MFSIEKISKGRTHFTGSRSETKKEARNTRNEKNP